MKQLYTLTVCLVAMAFSSVMAQVYVNNFPWAEDFESLNNCGTFCTAGCPNIGDFTQEGTRDWKVDNANTGSSNTGPSQDYNPGTLAGKYIYAEASFPCYSGTNSWIAVSPYFDMTNTNGGYELSFAWHMFGQSMGTAHFDVDTTGNGTWINDVIPSWTQNINDWEVETINLTSYAGADSVRFRIRYENPSNFWGDFAVDDFVMNLLLPDDAGITQILSPLNPFCGSDTQMVIELRNFGTNNLTSVTIDHTVGGTSGASISWTGNLATGQTDTITINTAAITPGTSIDASTSMPNNTVDLAPSNDESANTYYAGLAGTYQIPGDMASFEAAVDSMMAIGICDSVVFNVAAGTYTEQLSIPEILGAGPHATITFQGATGNAANVRLEYDPSSTFSQDGVVELDGVDWITFQDMTIDNTSATFSYGRVIVIQDATNHVNFDNVELNGSPTNTLSTNNVVVYGQGVTANDFMFNDVHFVNGSYAIRMFGVSATHSSDWTLNHCMVDSAYYFQTYFYYVDSLNVMNTEINVTSPYTGSIYGIYAVDCDRQMNLYGNRIYNTPGSEIYMGIYMSGCDGSLNNRLNLANNCITIGNPGDNDFAYGLYMTNSGLMDVHHNTVTNLNSGSTGHGHYIFNGGLIEEANNSFVTYGSGYARYVSSTYSMSASHTNNFYTNGTNVAFLGGTNYTSVEDFSEQTGFDLASVETDPAYTDTLGCASCNDTLDGGGTPIGLMVDINGQNRSVSTPDIGAIEFIAAGSFDLGGDSTYCADELLLEAGPAQSVSWNVDGNTSSNETYLLEATTGVPQLFNVSVNILTNGCGPASDNLQITLVPNASLDSAMHICADDTVTLMPGGGPNATYNWNTGDMTSTIDVDEAGTYMVTKMEDGCESSASIAVTQSDAVELVDIEECSDNLPVTVDATINDGLSYAWSGGSAVTSAVNTFNDADIYTVTATDAFGCISTSEFELTVLEAPVAQIAETHSGLAYFFDASASFYVTPSSSVLWDFGNGQTGSGLMDTVVFNWATAPNLVTYTVTLTIDNGCDEDVETIDITPDPLGVQEIVEGAFSVYPNPATDVLNIKLDQAFGEQGSIEIVDISGRVVMTETITAATDFAQMDVSSVSSGTYLVKITGNDRILINRVTIH